MAESPEQSLLVDERGWDHQNQDRAQQHDAAKQIEAGRVAVRKISHPTNDISAREASDVAERVHERDPRGRPSEKGSGESSEGRL